MPAAGADERQRPELMDGVCPATASLNRIPSSPSSGRCVDTLAQVGARHAFHQVPPIMQASRTVSGLKVCAPSTASYPDKISTDRPKAIHSDINSFYPQPGTSSCGRHPLMSVDKGSRPDVHPRGVLKTVKLRSVWTRVCIPQGTCTSGKSECQESKTRWKPPKTRIQNTRKRSSFQPR